MTFPPYHTTLPHLNKDNWRDHVAEKRKKQAALIPDEWKLPEGKYDSQANVISVPKECGILSGRELAITEIDDATELLGKIASREYSSYDVTLAFCKRAAIAHQLTNCLTEMFWDRALEKAKALDEHLEKTGKLAGPLHGLPVSLKDQFDIKGLELTMGYASYLGRISPENASLVDLLEAAGAVLYVRTNIPQTLMIGECENPVFGRTSNPHNRKLTPGGSSGGEGALVALKGSIIGVGTDIGGSVRIPSAFCGLTTIRPSTRRVPYGKATNSYLGQEAILSVAGPMTRSIATVKLFLRTVLDANASNYDASALPFPWNDQLYKQVREKKTLTFGVARSDGYVHMSPPLLRALDIVVEGVKRAGHQVVEFDLIKFKRVNALAMEIFMADGGEDVKRVISQIEEPLAEGLLIGGTAISVYDSFQLNREKEALQQAFLQEWQIIAGGKPIDGLLTAAVPIPACIPQQNPHVGYTCTFNLLDLPATVFPVTTVDPSVDEWGDKRPEPYGETDKGFIERFSAKASAGLPVTVQLVGRRWQEEALLALTERVQECLT